MEHILPSHPSLSSHDPLGLCEHENPRVWEVIVASIQLFRGCTGTLHGLPILIQDISYSIHLVGDLDTKFLLRFIQDKYPDASSGLLLLNNILDAAISLPTLFPTHKVAYLGDQNPISRLSGSQIRSLLAHQMLNTLTPPKGNTWGCTFTSWYSEHQAMEHAVSGYLTSLFDYFTLSIEKSHITYQYRRSEFKSREEELSRWMACSANMFDHLIIEPNTRTTVSFPHEAVDCVLVASNSSPGFGSSCTQEELVTAACPALLPMGALFVTPPVSSEAAILAYGDAYLSRWKGQGREARLLETLKPRRHVFVFLDASELDVSCEPEYLFRDLCKAYAGFMAIRDLGVEEIASPLWGAGAFGGDPVIKTLVLVAVGARCGVTVRLSVDRERMYGRRNLMEVIEGMKKEHRLMTVKEGMEMIFQK